MKATSTFVNSILYLLFVSLSAQAKEKMYGDPYGRINERHYEPPKPDSVSTGGRGIITGRSDSDGLNQSPEENDTVIIAGRSDGSTKHYEPPDEDNVNAATNVDPNSRYERPPLPTQAPIETNNAVPEGAPCTTSDGTFGIISDTALMTVPISYQYEMEAITGTSPSTINDDILPLVEKAIVDSILQEVFPDSCGSTAIGKRKLRIQRHLEVTGVSMYPPDYVTTSTCNVERSSSTLNECVVIDGELTLFTDDGDAAKEQFRIGNLIKENLNSGVYDDLSDKIVRLYYLDSSSSDPTESNTSDGEDVMNANGSEGATGRSERKSLKVGLFIGLGALVAVLAGVVFRTARKMSIINDDQTDMQSGGIQTYLDVDAHRSTSFA